MSAKNSLHNFSGFSPNQFVFSYNPMNAAESTEKIRRALRHKVCSYSDIVYINGDRVYYQRKDFKGWKGPALVLGQDGQYVLI